jgi:parallel beta-helix repeat protein
MPPRISTVAFATALLAALSLPAAASAAERYVSPSGSDSNPGTLAAPYKTIGKAAAVVAPGDTVYLRAGSYGGEGQVTYFSRAGSAGKPVAWARYPGDTAPRLLGKYQVRSSANYQRFTQVLIDGPTGDVGGNGVGGNSVLFAIQGDDVRLDHSEVRGSLGHAGVYIDAEAARVQIDHDWIHDNGAFGVPAQANIDHGIYFGSGSGLIENNVIEHNYARGVSLHYSPHDATVRNNTIVRNGREGVLVNGGANLVVANNVIAENGHAGGRAGLNYYAGSGSTRAVHNLFWDNAGGSIVNSSGSIPQSGNVTANPLFAPGSYQPGIGSPAVGLAMRSLAPADDYAGHLRDDAPDSGAFER